MSKTITITLNIPDDAEVLVTVRSEHLEDDARALRIAGRVAVDDHDVARLCGAALPNEIVVGDMGCHED